MNTKQIAEAVGQTDRSVRNWVQRMAEKSSSIAEKTSASNSTHPADFTVSETCQIIEEGLGKAAADVYRTNAVNAELSKSFKPRYSAAFLREYRLTYGIEAAKELLAELGFSPKPAQAVPTLPAPAASDAEYRAIVQLLGESGARQLLAVAHRIAEKHNTQATSDSIQGRLL